MAERVMADPTVQRWFHGSTNELPNKTRKKEMPEGRVLVNTGSWPLENVGDQTYCPGRLPSTAGYPSELQQIH